MFFVHPVHLPTTAFSNLVWMLINWSGDLEYCEIFGKVIRHLLSIDVTLESIKLIKLIRGIVTNIN